MGRAIAGAMTEQEFDVCVVGTGPAGSTVARELSRSALRVVVLESGSTEREARNDELDEIESIGRPRQMDQWLVRNRMLGGSSNTWWGRCLPFEGIDFEYRDWVPESGWPITGRDLDPFLVRASEHLGLPPGAEPEGGGSPTYASESGVLPVTWRYSRDAGSIREPMRFGRRLREDLGPNVHLVTEATVVDIRRASADEPGRVRFADRDGARHEIRARTVVLCAGGIENARLLLSSHLGNDLVGRFLMDHPRGTVARFDPRSADGLLDRFGWQRTGSGLQMRGFRLAPHIQRTEHLLNCSGWPEAVPAPDDPVEAARRLLRKDARDRLGDLSVVLRDLPRLLAGAQRHLRGVGSAEHRYSEVTLELMCEQLPDRTSRIVLAEREDRLGVGLPRIDWHISDEEATTLRRTTALISEELVRLGLPSPVPEPWVREGGMPPSDWTDIAHPTGTTRMSARAESGVVDEHCEVHGVPGLYIAGSSVFPTAGHANPTQTIVALAIRLADHIKSIPRPQF